MPCFYSTFRYCCRCYTVEILLFSDLAKNVHLQEVREKEFMQIGPRSSELYNFQKTHLLFKHPVLAALCVCASLCCRLRSNCTFPIISILSCTVQIPTTRNSASPAGKCTYCTTYMQYKPTIFFNLVLSKNTYIYIENLFEPSLNKIRQRWRFKQVPTKFFFKYLELFVSAIFVISPYRNIF